MIVNQQYILNRISFFISKKQEESVQSKKDLKLGRIKNSFPIWLRKIVFSSWNPFYIAYKERKKNNDTKSYNCSMHPVTIDFMKYCFTNNIQFDTDAFFDKKDELLILNFIDSRIKSVLAKYEYSLMNKEQLVCENIEKQILTNSKKTNGMYILPYDGIIYKFPTKCASYTVFECKYGLKYMPQWIHEYIQGKDFLDIGAMYGDASLMFLQYAPNKIYAYEPVKDSYDNLLKTIKINRADKIIPIKKGIGDKKETMQISIDSTNAGASTLINNLNIIDNPKVESIEITTIDEDCENKIVGLIKMDIEGFEYYAVKGGLKTIKRDLPILLISIYHTGKDFFEIPPMIKMHAPGYKFKFLDLSPHRPLSDKIIVGYAKK